MSTTAQFHEFGPFFRSGAIVTAPRIYHYAAGTSTLKNAYTTRTKAATVAQPLVGDSNGIASAYFDGLYKIVVTTANGVQLYSWDNWSAGDWQGSFVSISDHGAVGDGATDDSVAVKAAWTASGGGPLLIPDSHVFSGRFDSTSGDIGLSPLLPGFMGRFYHYYEPQYDLAANLLSVMHYFKTGTITIPTGKQHNVIRFDGTITGGTKFKGIDWQYTVTNSTDAYCAIGLLINQGTGSSKALYGRAQASTGCTGVVVGVVAGCTVDSGITPSAAMGLEISMDGTGSATEHSALRIDTAEPSNVIDYGLLSLSTVGYGNAFVKGFRRTGAGGNAFEWTDEPTGRDLFAIDENGNVAIGSVNDPQKTLSFASATTQYQMQGVTSGNFFRIRDNTAGNNLLQLAGGGSTDPVSIRVNSTMKQITEGAADSGGAGFKLLRVVN